MPRWIWGGWRTLAATMAITSACSRPIPPAVPTGSASPTEDVARVVRVVDGDTFRALVAGVEEPIRLIGVDTPEVGGSGQTEECYGEEASDFARRRLDGRQVSLTYDLDRRDRFDRVLAYVYLGRELFNLTLVAEGYATVLEVEPNTMMAGLLAAGEREARAANRGLWGACAVATSESDRANGKAALRSGG